MARNKSRFAKFATEFSDQSAPSEFVIPENLGELSAEDLTALHTEALGVFDSLYGEGQALSDEDVTALGSLVEGIEALGAEVAKRDAESAARAKTAAELAARVRTELSAEEQDSGEDEDENADEDEDEEEDAEGEPEAGSANTVTASAGGRKATRIPLSSLKRKNVTPRPQENDGAPGIRDVMTLAAEGLGFAAGTGLTMLEAGAALDSRLNSFNAAQYGTANRTGTHIRERHNLLSIDRRIPKDHMVTSNDPAHVAEVFDRVSAETSLPGGSLVAAGGWCAPSETVYDIIGENESRDGLLSVPEIGVRRGGISFTTGPDFRDIFSNITGFSFTEAQDVEGEYAPGDDGGPNVVGDKPCYKIECPDFEEYRLDVDGLCITGGLLQSRGFPEVQARTIRGALVAHDHRLNGKMIAQIAAGSTEVTMPSVQAGATAPLLTAIELQVEHYRYVRRLSRSTTLEAVFPFWVRGAIRSDLSRRLGVDMIDVTDARVDAWLRSRGVNPQYVYNWQALDGTADAAFTQWPTEVEFMLYAAGTWVRGVSDIITIDTLYDSALLGQNDYTALFTEEGWFVAKRGQDSRLVSVNIAPNGSTHEGQLIAADGTVVTP